MKSQRLLLSAAYMVMASIMVFALIDVVLAVWPLNLGETAWRFGAVGMISRNLIPVLLALLLTAGLASVAGHRAVLRLCGALCAAAVLVLLPITILFLLDTMELRASVQSGMLRPFELAAAVATFKVVVGTGVALVLGVASWSEARRLTLETSAAPASGMLVGTSH